MTVVAVFNQKGGVGKTTTALNVIAYLNGDGQRPYGIDLDPQGHLTLAQGLRNVSGEDSLFAFFMQKKRLKNPIRPGDWKKIASGQAMNHDTAARRNLHCAAPR